MRVAAEPDALSAPERLGREELEALQLARLRAVVDRILEHSPVLAARLRGAGLSAGRDLASLEAVATLPFVAKQDLRDHYPLGLLAVPREDVARLHASSGTRGKATVVAYTRGDLDTWTELMARCMSMAGVRRGMLVHNANGYGLFTGGFGFHQGAERLGATVLPCSGGFTTRQATFLRDLGAEVLVATPSYALAIAEALEASGGRAGLRLEIGLFGGEPWSASLRGAIESALGLRAMDSYGLSEMCGPGVAAECAEGRHGLHVHEDHFLVEVVDTVTGTRVAPGEPGELVFTTLTKEAMPLVRYRTGDLGRLLEGPCPCGRTTVRIDDLRGRRDDLLIVRGVNVHPSEAEEVLLSVPGVGPSYRLLLDRPGPLDELTVECEAAAAGVDEAALQEHLAELLRERLGLRVNIELCPPGSVPRSEGKALRVVDRRPARGVNEREGKGGG